MSGPNIVAIDDREDNLIALRAVLADALPMATLHVATSGPDGLELARERDPDVILLDIVMPRMDGFEVCRRLKADEKTRDIPVVFLTALGTERSARVRALEVGGDGFLGKPPDEQELAAQVRAMARRKAGHRIQRLNQAALVSLVNERSRELVAQFQERLRAEAHLREREQRYSHLFHQSNDAVFLSKLDADGVPSRFVEVNDVACSRLGYAREALLQLAPTDIAAEVARETDAAAMSILAESGRAVFETVHVTREGQQIPVEVSSHTFATEQGRFALSVVRDLTARKRVELELHAERDKLRAFLAAAPVPLFVLDEAELVVHTNPAARQLFGEISPGAAARFGDVIGCRRRSEGNKTCGDDARCSACSVYEAVREALAGRAITGRPLELELGPASSGNKRFVVLHAEQLALEGNRGVVLAVHDITELRRTQQEREKLQATLAQSDRLASMGMLAAGVAHEINNPLSYVIYNLESVVEDFRSMTEFTRRCHAELVREIGPEAAAHRLKQGHEPWDAAAVGEALEQLEAASSGANRIKHIVRGLGTFSRVESSDVVPLNVRHPVEHAASMAFNEVKYRARLVRDFDSVPTVLASEGKLAQVFLNLLVNAAHAIEEGHADDNEIRVRIFAQNETVCVEVRDTGRGIAPDDQRRIFEPFFTTKEVGVGTGLGLAICKTIVAEFGGDIEFDSEVGRGSRFVVSLPRAPADRQLLQSDRVKSDSNSAPRGRILVVDDEAEIRRAFVRLLGRAHEVHTAASGEEAMERLDRDADFDIVFCDLMMPRISGMALHRWIAARDERLADRVVFVTGGAFTPGARSYLAKLNNLRIEKPFDVLDLRRLAASLVAAQRPFDDPARAVPFPADQQDEATGL